ncbi:MAG: hypothetical protein A4E66_02575 [Syntrophus sp. PtaB.Bin001]|nr:MAG: hypothetical protein A4E66_02575 [Syntrophus sp. PtaB.Bin001]
MPGFPLPGQGRGIEEDRPALPRNFNLDVSGNKRRPNGYRIRSLQLLQRALKLFVFQVTGKGTIGGRIGHFFTGNYVFPELKCTL